MTLILYYVAFMIGGDLAAYLLGLLVEYEWGKQASLLVFLALYFLFLWVSWVLAVWVTTPRGATQVRAESTVDGPARVRELVMLTTFGRTESRSRSAPCPICALG